MPIRKVKGGYQYGTTGKVYKSRAKAVKQMRAIKAKKRAFTIIELVIVLALIAILSALLLPKLTSAYKDTKQDIIATYNTNDILVIDNDTGDIVYQGSRDNYNLDYTLVDVKYEDGIVIMYVSNVCRYSICD